MNNQSPLIPQGSLLEQKNKGRTRVKVAVFFVLALHGIGLLALLMQGCNRNEASGGSTSANSNAVAAATSESSTSAPSLPPAPAAPAAEASNTAPSASESSNAAVAPAPQPSNPPPVVGETGPAANSASTTSASDHKVAKGETLARIAKSAHVSLKALEEANPGIEPSKLKIGQTLHIPAPAVAAATTAQGGTSATSEAEGGEQVYVVKSGDSLTRIAKQFGVKVKTLRAANNMHSDRIKVGQKLKIPVKAAGSAATNAPAPTGQ